MSATVPAATGLAACCTVHLLVVAGVLGGLSGLAIGGIAVGAGAAVAAGVWLVAVLLSRRRGRAAPSGPPATLPRAGGRGHGASDRGRA